MKVEIPEFKRCCYCIPLRYGLIVWAYIKLVLTLMMFLFGALVVQLYIQFIFMFGFGIMPMILLGMTLLLFLMVDIGMTIVFLIGGHRKTVKLLKVFYIYNIVLLCVIAAILFISVVYDLSVGDTYSVQYSRSHRHQYMSYGAMVVTEVVCGVAFLGVQAYITLLIRSEVNKLNNSRNFRFTNIAAEGECSMENRNNEPGFGTHVHSNGTEDCEIGTDQLKGSFTKAKGTVTRDGTFEYNKF